MIALGLIWLRGYLVPGTPELTKNYMPEWMLSIFGKSDDEFVVDGVQHSSIDLESVLIENGILTDCESRDDLCLADSFEDELHDILMSIDQPEMSTIDVNDAELNLHRRGDGYVLTRGNRPIAMWPSQTELKVDIGGGDLLKRSISDWDSYSLIDKLTLICGLRVFLPTCPDDGGPVSMETKTVESCCSNNEVVAFICEDSGVRLLEQSLN